MPVSHTVLARSPVRSELLRGHAKAPRVSICRHARVKALSLVPSCSVAPPRRFVTLTRLLPPNQQLHSVVLPLLAVHEEGRMMAVAHTEGRLDILRCAVSPHTEQVPC